MSAPKTHLNRLLSSALPLLIVHGGVLQGSRGATRVMPRQNGADYSFLPEFLMNPPQPHYLPVQNALYTPAHKSERRTRAL